MQARQAGAFMRAFGDGTRLRILAALIERELSVGQLTSLLQCPNHKVSRHLRYLHARGVVQSRTAGNAVAYSLAKPQHPVHREVLAALRRSLTTVEEVRVDTAELKKAARSNA